MSMKFVLCVQLRDRNNEMSYRKSAQKSESLIHYVTLTYYNSYGSQCQSQNQYEGCNE